MTNEELIETLKEFDNKRVEQLDEKDRNLFYAIMSIADERDEYKRRVIELENMKEEIREYIKKWFADGQLVKYELLDILNKTNKENNI